MQGEESDLSPKPILHGEIPALSSQALSGIMVWVVPS